MAPAPPPVILSEAKNLNDCAPATKTARIVDDMAKMIGSATKKGEIVAGVENHFAGRDYFSGRGKRRRSEAGVRVLMSSRTATAEKIMTFLSEGRAMLWMPAGRSRAMLNI